MPTVEEIQDWPGRTAIDRTDDKVGKIDHLYVDRQTGEPTFAAIKTGLFGGNDSLVPLEGAKLSGDDVHLAYEKDKIKDAPNVEADGELSEDEEARLYEHYGIGGYSQYEGDDHETLRDRDVDVDVDRDRTETEARGTVDREGDGTMTRSEEEVRIGTTQRQTGKARLKKYIVTENVTKTVPVSREEVRIEREPITDGEGGGGELSESEAEVTLHAEEPVVEKNVVAKERVSLQTDTVTDEVEVSEEVRKEQIDTDVDGDAERR